MSTTQGSLQYLRRAQIIIGSNGQGISVTDLRIEFKITKTLTPAPNEAVIKIYNLSQANQNLIQKTFKEVLINAGYKDSMRLIFRGNIKRVFHYRKGNDYITEIEAGDGDHDYRHAFMNLTLSAGTTDAQLLTAAVQSFSSTIMGTIGIDTTKQRSRGRAIFGSTRHILNTVARASNANWSIQDGALTIIGASAVSPTEAIVLNSETGLLSAPTLSDKGIEVKALLNPQFTVNGTLKLDNNNIRLKVHAAKEPKQNATAKPKAPIRLDPDGLYKIIRFDHDGDTRGPKWITDIICIGVGQPIPQEEIGTYGE